jgi:hypothetical protein
MNSRERLIKCIKHESVDRVPISTSHLTAYDKKSWANQDPSYHKLMEYIEKYTDCIYPLNPELKNKNLEFEEIKSWDEIPNHYTQRIVHTPGGDLKSLDRWNDDSSTIWKIEYLLKEFDDLEKYFSLPYEPPEIDMTEFYSAQNDLGENGLMEINIGDAFGLICGMFMLEDILMIAVSDPVKLKYYCDQLHERNMNDLKNTLKCGLSDVIITISGPEFATAPLLPPELFRYYVTDNLMEMCREIKAYGVIPRIHCHGRIKNILNQFCMTEAMMLDPIEPCPDGDIDLADVKRICGKQFCLMGNVEMRELECGFTNKARIDRLVKQAMDSAKEGSGYILLPTSFSIVRQLPKSTEENYIQMIDSALEYGRYT